MRIFLLTALLAACRAPLEPADACVDQTTTHPGTGVFGLHATADGALVSVGPEGAWSRSPAGAWSALGGPRGARRATSFGERLWVVSGSGVDSGSDERDAVHLRDGGAWIDLGFDGRATALIALGPADLRVLDHRDTPVSLHTSEVNATLDEHRWDGEGWRTTRVDLPSPDTRGAAYLPDGRVLVVADEALWVSTDTGWDPIPTPAPITGWPTFHDAAPGTIAFATDHHRVWVGDLDGVAPLDAQTDVSILAVTARAPNDVWIAGGPFDAAISHWDGASLTEVARPARGGLYALAALPTGEVFAAGGAHGAVVLRVDGAGVVAERDTVDAPAPHAWLAVDDVTGVAWSFGDVGLARSSASGWEPVRLDDWTPDHLPAFAVSGGRLAHFAEPRLTVREPDGTRSTFPTPPDVMLYTLCGAEGALFAVGRHRHTDAPRGFVNRAGAWEAMEGLPVDGWIESCWADGPNDLWLGLSAGRRGALARWSDAGSEVVARDLDGVPTAITRHADGALRVISHGASDLPALSTWDGAALTPELAGVSAAWRTSDGVWFALERDDEGTALTTRAAGGPWQTVARFGPHDVPSLVGSGRQVWAQGGETIWSRTCGP